MNLQELSAYLQYECYQPDGYHVGPGWSNCGDAYCIDKIGSQYEVFYVECGERRNAFYCGDSESVACDTFLSFLNREHFSRAHCVGSFIEKSEAEALVERLASLGIRVHRDIITYSNSADFRYRVFVFGRDKIRAQEVISK